MTDQLRRELRECLHPGVGAGVWVRVYLVRGLVHAWGDDRWLSRHPDEPVDIRHT